MTHRAVALLGLVARAPSTAIAARLDDRCGDNAPCVPSAEPDGVSLFCDYAIGPEPGGYCQRCLGEITSFCESFFNAQEGNVLELTAKKGVEDCHDKCKYRECTEPCGEGEYCTYYNYVGTGCEACDEGVVHPDACVSFGSFYPPEGIASCEETCPARSCWKSRQCVHPDEYIKFFCNRDEAVDEAWPEGTCTPCANLTSVDECADISDSEEARRECVEICESVLVTSCAPRIETVEGQLFSWENQVNEHEACGKDQFCYLADDYEYGDYAYTCMTCPQHAAGDLNAFHVDDCLEQDIFGTYMEMNLTDMTLESCARSCHTFCHENKDGFISVEGLVEWDGYNDGYKIKPMDGTIVREVTGPLVDCQLGGLGECPPDAPPGFVCLVSRGVRNFVNKVVNCEDAGGIGVILYDNEEVGIVQGDVKAPLEISIAAISLTDGLYLQEHALGLNTTLRVTQGEEWDKNCHTGCSDRIPCPSWGYCAYEQDNGTVGFCQECSGRGKGERDEDQQRRRCFLEGLSLKGAQECVDKCQVTLAAASCKTCGEGVDGEILKSAPEGEPPCDFCPGPNGLDPAYFDRKMPFVWQDATCKEVNKFFSNYRIAEENPNCQLAKGFNHICGCEGPGYVGADTPAKRRALVWVPRMSSILSLAGSSFIIVDVARDPDKRRKPYGKLMVVMSIFDLVGSLGYSFTSLPIPKEYGIEGAKGNEATCKAQGFSIQMGTVASFVNVSLATYYYCVIHLGWGDTSIEDILRWLFLCPIVLGLGMAIAGIWFYRPLYVWCNNSGKWWPDIPVMLAILAMTGIMGTVCYSFWKTESASSAARMANNSGPAPQSMSSKMFWQSFWYLVAFYLTWVPYLGLQFAWSVNQEYGNYAWVITASTLAPLQGFSNFLVYFRRRAKKRFANALSMVRNRLSTPDTGDTGGTSGTGGTGSSQSKPRKESGQ